MPSCATCSGAWTNAGGQGRRHRGAGGNFCSGGDVHEIIGPLTRMDEAACSDFTRMTGDLVRADAGLPAADHRRGRGRLCRRRRDHRDGQRPSPCRARRQDRLPVHAGRPVRAPTWGACAILPRIIGQGRAAELLFTGRSMTAEEGVRLGLLEPRRRQCPCRRAGPCARARRRAPTVAHAVTKNQLDAEWHVSIEEALEMEAEAQAHCMQTKDFHRAYEAFAAKRKPEFQGD